MRWTLVATAGLCLAGCSAQESAPADRQAPELTSSTTSAAEKSATGQGVTLPQLAYRYSLRFLVPGERMTQLQDRHRALCEAMGAARCQLLGLEQADAGSGDEAVLHLQVASAEASRFQATLDGATRDAGGRSLAAKVDADDSSKDIVDAQARIRQREVLIARLTQMLKTQNGKVADLVQAERTVTQAQEELDQARTWLATLKGRVAMSDFDIRYTPLTPVASASTMGAELGETVQSSAVGFIGVLKTLAVLAIYLLPWALLLSPFLYLHLRRRRSAATQG
jgi:TolA-binding protein